MLWGWKGTLPNTREADVAGSGVSEKGKCMGNRWWHQELTGDIYHSGASEKKTKGCVSTHCENLVNEVKNAVCDVLLAQH